MKSASKKNIIISEDSFRKVYETWSLLRYGKYSLDTKKDNWQELL